MEECYLEPCYAPGLKRTFHEYEGRKGSERGDAGFSGYYDFVYHYVRVLSPISNYITSPVIDQAERVIIGIEEITMNPGLFTENSNEYIIRFDVAGIIESEFLADGKLTIFTHLREKDYRFEDYLVRRKRSWINYWVISDSGYFLNRTYDPNTNRWDTIREDGSLHIGDWVTVYLEVENEDYEKVSDGRIRISVVNHEDLVANVVWENGDKYVTTNNNGIANFSFPVLDDATIKANFLGDWNNAPSEVSFHLTPVVESPILSIEFFMLLIIAFFIIFSYRWFRRKRLDLYAMWQELKGEIEE